MFACHIDNNGNIESLKAMIVAFNSEPGKIIAAHMVTSFTNNLVLSVYHLLREIDLPIVSLTRPQLDDNEHVIWEKDNIIGSNSAESYYTSRFYEQAIKVSDGSFEHYGEKLASGVEYLDSAFQSKYLASSSMFVDARTGYFAAGYLALPDQRFHDQFHCVPEAASYLSDSLETYPHIKAGWQGVLGKSDLGGDFLEYVSEPGYYDDVYSSRPVFD